MGDPLRKPEFLRQNGKVGTYRAVDSFPKKGCLIRVCVPNPLGDAPKYIKRLHKNCLKASHLLLCSKLRDSGNLLSS